MIYLDNAATSAKKPFCVFAKLFKESLFTSVNAGRGAHSKSLRALKGINDTADLIAKLFNIESGENIAFLPNATYALNAAILGTVKPGDHIITTSIEHNSVLRPISGCGNYTIVSADKNGYVNPSDIEKEITDKTKLIICSHASNVCGAIQPVKKIGEIANKHNIKYLIDAAQSAGCLEINAKDWGADFIAFSGHKGLLGPLGTGGLYVKPGTELSPYITGGTGSESQSTTHPLFMPDILHTGTLNTPAIIALGTAVKALETPQITYEREKQLAENFISDLKNMNGVEIFGPISGERNGTVSFRIKNSDPAELESFLDKEKGIIVRAGYHCAPLAHKTLGSDKTGTVRVSFGYYNTDYDRLCISDAINEFLKKNRI